VLCVRVMQMRRISVFFNTFFRNLNNLFDKEKFSRTEIKIVLILNLLHHLYDKEMNTENIKNTKLIMIMYSTGLRDSLKQRKYSI
jgi:hypothetical protein